MGGAGFGMGGWMWLAVLVGVAAFWGVIVLLLRELIRGPQRSQTPPEPPLAVLDRRLANGEISVEEYLQARRALTDGH
ncbi:MAG: SHOCT domain-containing protein [Actinomycetales bacterium]